MLVNPADTNILRPGVLAPLLAAVLFVVGLARSFADAQVPVQAPSTEPSVEKFCIPARDSTAAEVTAIDPTVQIYAGSPAAGEPRAT